ncbi:hypothetical protein [Scytonema millei]|uniref:Uncharacterized protein n=1 Tax=Scytonema millei VB511283 TaxID=1245923 RepID=A0A9X5E712_9CYAN|nr:hypothetical protein [Scytonema millei]NHC36545.1 hypothetical protein [Scytonema millei VB511283]
MPVNSFPQPKINLSNPPNHQGNFCRGGFLTRIHDHNQKSICQTRPTTNEIPVGAGFACKFVPTTKNQFVKPALAIVPNANPTWDGAVGRVLDENFRLRLLAYLLNPPLQVVGIAWVQSIRKP